MNQFYTIIFALCLFSFSTLSAQQDSTRKIGFSGIPVLTSAPETGFRYGVYGQLSFDLYPNNFDSRQSQAGLAITHSTRNQLSIGSSFLLFGLSESYVLGGELDYALWFDQHYGLGNDASNQVIEYYNDENRIDTLNYLNYSMNLFQTNLTFLKQLKKGFFVGLATNVYSGSNFKASADSIENFPSEIQENQIVGQYYGVGLNVIYDTRDNINNPLKGTYIQLQNLNHRKWLGGDFEFSNIVLEARQYVNTYKKQILALRFISAFTFSDDVVPFMGYQRLGGKDSMRGYYNGTFLDRNMMSFDVEYRLPLFHDEAAPLWKIWRHLGVTAFASAGQVFGEASDFALSEFHYAAGGGLRIMLSKTQRTNIRVDYGLGFSDNAGGIGERQRGLYITVNEIF